MSARSTFAAAILLLFVGVSVLGVGMSMMTDAQGHMSNCPFMNGLGSICQMNIFDHLSHWQSLFIALSPTNSSVSPILLLTVIFIAFAFWPQSNRENKSQFAILFHQQTTPSFFDPLRAAFARGVLHSKIYDIVAIR